MDRLDRETSGLMVFALTTEAQKHLQHQFRKHSIRRRYVAVVRGFVEEQTIESRLETGRTHQIRIHLSEAGHPLCGDKVYWRPLLKPGEPDTSGATRLALAAVELGFEHPATGQAMSFETPLPPDLTKFVQRPLNE